MLTLYFSGTGNTKFVAERFSNKLNYECHSIEERIDFAQLIKNHACICVCYPIYSSRVPYIFREFINKYKDLFKNKRIIILVTQYMFSGDGARAFTDLFPKNYFNVIYAEHLLMPNNICNFDLFPIKSTDENRIMIQAAAKKIDKICGDIITDKTVKRGFNPISRLLGLPQGLPADSLMERGRSSVKVDDDCVLCGKCVEVCPMANLTLTDNKIITHNNCTICYRCVNLCPSKAITAFINKKPTKQYTREANSK